MLLVVMPKTVSWSVSPLNSSTPHWTGLTNSSLLTPHFMRLGIGNEERAWLIISPNRDVVAFPDSNRRTQSLSCFPSLSTLFDRSVSSNPFLRANACAALVASPSLSNATFIGGPQETTSLSGERISISLMITAKRLGAAND